MPRRDNIGLSLHQAHDLGNLIRVECYFCRKGPRYYHPKDLVRLLGNREIDSLRRRLKCEICGKRDYVEVDTRSPPASERMGMVVRRLVRIREVRRPVWRDERL